MAVRREKLCCNPMGGDGTKQVRFKVSVFERKFPVVSSERKKDAIHQELSDIVNIRINVWHC